MSGIGAHCHSSISERHGGFLRGKIFFPSIRQSGLQRAKGRSRPRWRRLAALHCELSRLTVDGYFLSYRDAAKVFDGLSHREAYEITGALATLGVITFVGKGQPGLISGKASEFRYLLSQTENGAAEDAGFDL
jgi:hypothetical protein